MVRRKSWPMDDALTKASKNMNRAMYGNSRRKGNVHHHYHSSRRTGPQHVIHEDYESYRRRKNKELAIILPIVLIVIAIWTIYIFSL